MAHVLAQGNLLQKPVEKRLCDGIGGIIKHLADRDSLKQLSMVTS